MKSCATPANPSALGLAGPKPVESGGGSSAAKETSARRESDVERWRRELYEAGWKDLSRHFWRSPTGEQYRGPYKAWCVMKGIPCELPSVNG